LDESGTHDQSKIAVLAGLIGSLRQWERFAGLYQRIGSDAHTPGFHASEYFVRDPTGHRIKAYKTWSDERAARLLNGLVQAVAESEIRPILAALDVGAFESYSEPDRLRLTGYYQPERPDDPRGAPHKPYYLLLQSVIVQAAARVKRAGLRVHFVCDQQLQFAAYALQLYAYVKRTRLWQVRVDRLGDLQFASRKDTLALHAADLLAYSWYQRHTQARKAVQPEIKAVLDQWAHKNLEGDFLNKRSMDHLLGKASLERQRTYDV